MGRLGWTGAVAVIAGVLVALGSVLDWIALDSTGVTLAQGEIAGSATGIETGLYGWAGLILGTLLVVGALLGIIRPLRKLAAPIVLLGGVTALGLAIFVFISLQSRFVDYAVREAASAELPAARIRSLFGSLFEGGSISARPAIGLILLAVGGAIAIIAGIMGLARGRFTRPPTGTALVQKVPSPPSQRAKDKFGF